MAQVSGNNHQMAHANGRSSAIEHHGTNNHYSSSGGDSSDHSTNNISINRRRPSTAITATTTKTTDAGGSNQSGPDILRAHYDIQKTIGKGTFAKVKLAIHRPTGMQVAIKCIDKSKLPDEYSVRNMHREARIMKTLHHPYIVRLLEVLETAQELFLVMEYVSGGEILDYIVAHDHLRETEAKNFTAQILSALEYCHDRRVIHRDLKPENLLINGQQMTLKITDFGLSTVLKQAVGASKLSTFCGSPLYSAPELIEGRVYNGPEVDMWGLGVIVYIMVTGRRPFEQRNIAALAEAIRHARYEPPSGVSNECRLFINSLLEVDSLQRATLEQAKQHPWVREAYRSVSAAIHVEDVAELNQTELDPHIVDYLSDLFRVSREEIITSVQDNRYDNLAASYYLLDIQRRRLGSFTGMAKQPPSAVDPTATAVKTAQVAQHQAKLNRIILPEDAKRRPVTADTPTSTAVIKTKAATVTVATRNNITKPRPVTSQQTQRPRSLSVNTRNSTINRGPVKAEEAHNTNNNTCISSVQQQRSTSPALDEAKTATLRTRRYSTGFTAVRNDPSVASPLINQLHFKHKISIGANGNDGGTQRRPSTSVAFTVNNGTNAGTNTGSDESPKIIGTSISSSAHNNNNNTNDNYNNGGIRTVRFAFNCSTTSTQQPDDIVKVVKQSLTVERIQFKLDEYVFRCVAGKKLPSTTINSSSSSSSRQDGVIEFEIEICRLPRLALHGIKFRRVRGDVWEYKLICVHLMKIWHLS